MLVIAITIMTLIPFHSKLLFNFCSNLKLNLLILLLFIRYFTNTDIISQLKLNHAVNDYNTIQNYCHILCA